ncbi:MAG: hypothetical protein QM784_12490 [Polyangiaceae bacterium]
MSLIAARAFYMYSDAELCERAFEGKTWDDVDDRLLGGRSDALAFMSRERQLTWLPAYLNHVATADPMHSPVWSTLMSMLTAPDPKASSARKRRRFEADFGDKLTLAQRRVVARTLQLVIERHPAWGKEPRIASRSLLGRVRGHADGHPGSVAAGSSRCVSTRLVIADVFVEDDWRYCELYDYQRAIQGKTWRARFDLVS